GKVPRRVIEARIGRDALVAEAIEHEAVPEFYARAIEEHGVRPLTPGEVKPELDLPGYRGVAVERPAIEVTDEMVDGQLDRLRERVAQLEVIGRPRMCPRRWAGRAGCTSSGPPRASWR